MGEKNSGEIIPNIPKKDKIEVDGISFEIPEETYADFNDQTSRYSILRRYNRFQPELTKQHEAKILEMKKMIEGENWLKDDNWQLLVMSSDESISGLAEPDYGMVGLREDIFTRPNNEAMQKAALSHERMHLQISSERRQFILSHHCDVDDFFHRRIIPDWINSEEIKLGHDEDYFSKKRWYSLYDGWTGSADVTLEKIEAVIDAYFKALKKGQIYMDKKGNIGWLPSPHSNMWKEAEVKPELPLEELYKKDPQSLVKQICTGYQLAKYLHDSYRHALGNELKASIHDIDESFANYVSSELSGVTFDEMQRWHPQDIGKIKSAKEIQAMAKSKGKSYKEAIEKIKSYRDMVAYYRELKQ